MKQTKPIQLHIPSPCSQNWDDMTANAQGRFCDHCSKTVIDFTTYTDAALHSFFSKNTAPICGRFHSSQLSRNITIPHQPHSQLYRITIALGLTLLFTQTPQLLAQNRPPKTEQSSLIKQGDTTTINSGEIRGQVLDEHKDPMPSAVIQVYQNGILKGGGVSDYDGMYSIKPLNSGNYDILVLYTGYDSIAIKDVIVKPEMTTTLNFSMPRPLGRKLIMFGGISRTYIDPRQEPGRRVYTREEINQMPH